MRTIAALALVLSAAVAQAMPNDLDAWAGKARARVARALKDPGSAQYRGLFVARWANEGADHPVLCGEVNARNGFGGYAGFQRFVADDHGTVLDLSEDGWQDFCGRRVKSIR